MGGRRHEQSRVSAWDRMVPPSGVGWHTSLFTLCVLPAGASECCCAQNHQLICEIQQCGFWRQSSVTVTLYVAHKCISSYL